MIYLIFFIGFLSGFLIGCFLNLRLKKIKNFSKTEKYDDDYKKLLEFDGSL